MQAATFVAMRVVVHPLLHGILFRVGCRNPRRDRRDEDGRGEQQVPPVFLLSPYRHERLVNPAEGGLLQHIHQEYAVVLRVQNVIRGAEGGC